MTEDVSPEAFDAAFDATAKEMEKTLARESLEADATGMSVTKAISALAQRAADADLILTIQWDADAEKATIGISGKRGRKASTGSVSSNSNISAWTAYQRGIKAGDTFKIRKVEGGYKEGERFIPKRANGGLCAYILKTKPSSKTAKILGDYGKTL